MLVACGDAADTGTMNVRASAVSACAIALGCLSIGGCGDTASRAQQDLVRQLVPKARDIRCTRGPESVTRCQAVVGTPWQGIENWSCEFTVNSNRELQSYSGTRSCWSRNGTQKSLRLPTD
jgi:hypothetical protein